MIVSAAVGNLDSVYRNFTIVAQCEKQSMFQLRIEKRVCEQQKIKQQTNGD